MKTGAVIVLYNPTKERLSETLQTVAPQVDVTCLVDNSPTDHQEWFAGEPNLVYLPLHKNVGIAAAQNAGINLLKDNDCQYALFCDQDSLPEKDTVRKLLAAQEALQQKGYAVGVVGTKPYNRQTGQPYQQKSKLIRIIAADELDCGMDISECYSLISSISLIPIGNFEKAGLFDEALFIDGVDHEWCWRAWHKAGLRSFMVEQAPLFHQIGEGDKKIGAKNVSIPAPFRVYYQYRNYLWLCQRSYVPSFWKKRHLLKYAVKMFYYPLYVSPRGQYARHIAKGIFDGLFKKDKTWQSIQEKKD